MKRIGYGLVLAALTAAGCAPTMTFFQDGQKPPKVELKPAPPPQAVTPDTVTEKNAADKAKALREELEHELNARPAGDVEP
ncbi:MAG: hypothetical protein U0797_20245 [Gemmataceae bacterium]